MVKSSLCRRRQVPGDRQELASVDAADKQNMAAASASSGEFQPEPRRLGAMQGSSVKMGRRGRGRGRKKGGI
jgi:hypothetical protein